MLLISGYHHYQVGISPLARNYRPPQITAHHRLAQEFMALIPPDAPLSTQSGLYPHLAHREKAYFFPAVNDAKYILLDVTGTSYPIGVSQVYDEVQELLRSSEFGVLAARDGYLLLQRGSSGEEALHLPEAFYTFARVGEGTASYPLRARFGDVLELVGYDYSISNVVQAQQLPATVTTYWRALQPVSGDYAFAFFFSRQGGAIVSVYDGATPTTAWYPAHRWEPGEVIRMETPILSVGRLHEAMVAVLLPGADPWPVEGRLQPIERAADGPLTLYEQGTLLKLFRFP
jgi:hypothetical protein